MWNSDKSTQQEAREKEKKEKKKKAIFVTLTATHWSHQPVKRLLFSGNAPSGLCGTRWQCCRGWRKGGPGWRRGSCGGGWKVWMCTCAIRRFFPSFFSPFACCFCSACPAGWSGKLSLADHDGGQGWSARSLGGKLVAGGGETGQFPSSFFFVLLWLCFSVLVTHRGAT